MIARALFWRGGKTHGRKIFWASLYSKRRPKNAACRIFHACLSVLGFAWSRLGIFDWLVIFDRVFLVGGIVEPFNWGGGRAPGQAAWWAPMITSRSREWDSPCGPGVKGKKGRMGKKKNNNELAVSRRNYYAVVMLKNTERKLQNALGYIIPEKLNFSHGIKPLSDRHTGKTLYAAEKTNKWRRQKKLECKMYLLNWFWGKMKIINSVFWTKKWHITREKLCTDAKKIERIVISLENMRDHKQSFSLIFRVHVMLCKALQGKALQVLLTPWIWVLVGPSPLITFSPHPPAPRGGEEGKAFGMRSGCSRPVVWENEWCGVRL